jgi:hypothetical protein
MKITLDINKAVIELVNFIDKDRRNLNCVLVEIGEKSVTYVATNGHILQTVELDQVVQDPVKKVFCVSPSLFKGVKIKKGESAVLSLNFNCAAIEGELKTFKDFNQLMVTSARTEFWQEDDYTYPEYRQALPSYDNTGSVKAIGLSARYMGKISKYYCNIFGKGEADAIKLVFTGDNGVISVEPPNNDCLGGIDMSPAIKSLRTALMPVRL